MWSYYGRKKQIIKKYPAPKHRLIIEPFAGTASYAMHYWNHDVVLIDVFDVVIRIWSYLKQANPKDILSLPDVSDGEFIGDKYQWMSQEEKWLVGFCINGGSPTPKYTAGRMNFNYWNKDKIRIANDLYKIRHWNFVLGDYKSVCNVEATWFVDAPYQFQKLYRYNNVDYKELSKWCKSRRGQTIVCENSFADWMEFSHLTVLAGQRTKTLEVIWNS